MVSHTFSVTLTSLLSMASTRFLSLLFLLIIVNKRYKIPWFFSRCENHLLVDFYHFAIVPGGLGGHCCLPLSNSQIFLLKVKEFADFYKNGYAQWQMGNVHICLCFWLSKPYFSSLSRTIKFCQLLPNTQENKVQLTTRLKANSKVWAVDWLLD